MSMPVIQCEVKACQVLQGTTAREWQDVARKKVAPAIGLVCKL